MDEAMQLCRKENENKKSSKKEDTAQQLCKKGNDDKLPSKMKGNDDKGPSIKEASKTGKKKQKQSPILQSDGKLDEDQASDDRSGQGAQATGGADFVLGEEPVKRKFCSPPKFSMDTQNRGAVLIINNVTFDHMPERKESETDRDTLCQMFHFLGWIVTTEYDLKAKDMDRKLKTFAVHSHLNSVSAIAVVILTHGMENDIYFGTDGCVDADHAPVIGSFINRFELMENFSSSNCPIMIRKPKLFILQACRGGNIYKPQEQPIYRKQQPPETKPVEVAANHIISQDKSDGIPDTADMCFLFATSSGYVSSRILRKGSPFINSLNGKVRQLSRTNHVLDIFTQVIGDVSYMTLPKNIRMCPEVYSQLTSDWYLNPPLEQ